MNTSTLLLSVCPLIIEMILHTPIQSTHWFNVTHGGLYPARFAFVGHATFLTLFIASSTVSAILFL